MSKKPFMQRALAVAASAMVACGALAAPAIAQPTFSLGSVLPGVWGTPPAGAQQMVTFGDSFSAIGPMVPGNGAHTEKGYQIKPTCKKDTRNWPHSAAQTAGKTLADWSCNGTGGMVPLGELPAVVAESILAGNIGPGTEKVVIMYGGLDAFNWLDVASSMANAQAIAPSMMQGVYANIKMQVAQAAPGAEVVIAGYPEIADNDRICMVAMIPDQPTPTVVPGAEAVQQHLRNAGRHAAEANGLRFIDTLELTRGHGTCAKQPQDRWVVGSQDPAVPTNLGNHPSINGSIEIGKIIGTELYR
ncbi:GDSL-type esterase/lipase family protein [Corynebacterium uberis]|uniref:GDSL-type esterase/lipase family protein n=1 Tax=Corynebacterium TaxID=1716 RepID=UPI001D0A6EC6|nr:MULTISPECIES: GDSL-type esterase/lipase family protein [Corynebacterium]MCZ9308225.1 GDSL-type esterase/lipase family protein [Corynebacterium sp. c6VSa_13]UDL73905.1 GDSL-type esterase/lipase family protein [Corynebacterium uberis]UDL75212.1 GDSL-type esterase/lipase family protein [Corynebacterium uberis]UDL77423.1 GDSL-type esterase/lipase family protein [Corynebacterium uberis]UDL79708.1 GDSL-type esterase/lipase family protein [Corynebacterium uberis]